MRPSAIRSRVARTSATALMGLAVWLASPAQLLAASDSGLWGHDPFGAPPGETLDSGAGPEQDPMAPAELQGIIAGPGGMVAIIDQRIVRIGDRLGAELVEEITPRAVTLRRGPHVRRLVISVLPMHGR